MYILIVSSAGESSGVSSGPPGAARAAARPAIWSSSRLIAHWLSKSSFHLATSYPGSPTTEITDELERLDKRGAIRFRYATNEKIAFEMAFAVALAGGRAAVVMKHVGLNVALDSVFGAAYTGHRGALVLIVGDDPGLESSSTAQDTRLMARLLGVPCFEPSSLDDVEATLALALGASESTRALVIVRLTTALAHGSGPLDYRPADGPAPLPPLAAPAGELRYTVLPASSRDNHPRAIERLASAQRAGEGDAFWDETPGAEGAPFGVVVQNPVYPSLRRACARLGLDLPVLRTRMAWPLAEGRLRAFVARHRRVVVVEELEDFLESAIAALAHREGLSARVEGRAWFPRVGRLDEDRLVASLAELAGLAHVPTLGKRVALDLAPRPPTFCAGCPHTASLYSLKSVFESLPERPHVAQDIGCYSMGFKAGIDVGDSSLCMGAGIGVATGLALAGRPSVALIGDSTFMHAGLPALKNAAAQGVDLLICVLHNGQAAMTGAPATDSPDGFRQAALALGAAAAEVVDPFDVEATRSAARRLFATKGVSVLVAASPCALTVPPKPRRPRVDLERCTGCGDCVTKIHCPAISLGATNKFEVDVDTCVGCGFCSSICPEGALTPEPYE